MFAEAKNTTVT